MRRPRFPGLDPKLADKLKQLGAKRSSDYYKLSYKDQLSLVPHIPLGGIALDPADPNYRCTELELPANPEPGIITPVVDWTWRGPFADQDHIIDTRPWWGFPDQEVDESSSKFEEQKYWYPDPALGWKIFGYAFGGTGGQLGYLLVYNNFTGIMRLFVYLPGVEEHNFNELLCRISITNPGFEDTDLWAFPLQDQPPTIQNFERSPVGSGGPQEEFDAIPRSLTASWPGQDLPYHELSAAVSGANGVWLRTEIPTLYDPRLYPSTQPLRPLGGCLSIFFPGGGSGNEIRQDDRRMLRMRFYNVKEGQTELEANLHMELSGKAVPSSGEEDVLGVLKNTFLTSKAAVNGAMEALAFIGVSAASGGGATVIVAAGLAGAYFGLTDNGDVPPEYIVKMLGTATGSVSGKTVFITPSTTFDLNITDTFIPGIDNEGQHMPVGFPQNYQRCELVRFGLFGFRPHGTGSAYLDLDPRPASIFQSWYTDSPAGNYNVPYVIVDPIGYFQVAPWAEIDIISQRAQLEIINFSGRIPYERIILVDISLDDFPTGDTISRAAAAACQRVFDPSLRGHRKLLIRWFATIQPRNALVPSYTVQYALDVTHLLVVEPEPGLGTDEWP